MEYSRMNVGRKLNKIVSEVACVTLMVSKGADYEGLESLDIPFTRPLAISMAN